MSFQFLSPAYLGLLGVLPLIVLLHLVRARRVRREVSALFLWERASRAAASRRKVRPTWLLLVQLAFAGAAALALARPALVDAAASDVVIVVDASASMAAIGRPSDGASRLDLARELATELLRGAPRAAIVRAGLEPTLLAPLEATPTERLAALEGLQAADAGGDLSAALALAATLLPGATTHVLTDAEASLGSATVHVVGAPVENVGISAFEVGIGQVFVGVVASGLRPVQAEVALERDGAPMASTSLLVPAGGVGTVTFPVQDASGVLTARLVGPADALSLDDVAYAGNRAVEVVTDDTHGAVTRALQAIPNVEVRYSRGAALLTADLRVLTSGAVTDDAVPTVRFAAAAERPDYRVVRDFDRAEPLLRFSDLSDVVVGLDPSVPRQEEEGWRTIARTSDLTPVARMRTDGPLLLDLSFHPSQTDLTLRPAFPALFANVVASLSTTQRVRLGEGAAEGGPWLEPGAHVMEDGRVVLASLLSAQESRLPATAPFADGRATAVTTADATSSADGPADVEPTGPGAAAGASPTDRPAEGASGRAGRGDEGPTRLSTALVALAAVALAGEWLLRLARPVSA